MPLCKFLQVLYQTIKTAFSTTEVITNATTSITYRLNTSEFINGTNFKTTRTLVETLEYSRAISDGHLRVLMFGGWDGFKPLDELWSFTYSSQLESFLWGPAQLSLINFDRTIRQYVAFAFLNGSYVSHFSFSVLWQSMCSGYVVQ